MKEIRTHARPLYPGSFLPEEGESIRIASGDDVNAVVDAIPDDGWFAVEVSDCEYTRFASDEGDERWLPTGKATTRRIYVGEELTVEDVAQLPGEYSILLSNMRGNGWSRVVKTRRGNFQPVNPEDVVLSAVTA